jgi:hypothetical protein
MSTNHNANSGAAAPSVAPGGAPGKSLHSAATTRRKPIFSRGAVVGLFVAASAAVGLTFYGSQSVDATQIKAEKIWHGTGTVISRNEVPGSRKTNEHCLRFCSYEATRSWELTIREDSGEVINVPVTKGQFDAISPGETFTRK